MSTPAELPYLDYAATTPVDPRVAECMAAYLQRDGTFGNPASTHRWGQAAAACVEQAAAQVGALIGAAPDGVVWTSGATEADNLAVLGAARFVRERGRGNHVLSVRTEHPAVLGAVEQLRRDGMDVTLLTPSADGSVSVDQLGEALRDDTALVSVMHVNNETGAVQDIAAIGSLLREHRACLHVDAAQSAGRVPIRVEDWGVDLLSLSAHKLYGPKGVGVLWVRPRPRLRLSPLLHGGGQQGGLRPGTLAPHLIAGMGEASALADNAIEGEPPRLRRLRERFRKCVTDLDAVVVNGQPNGSPHILNVSFGCVNGDALRLDIEGLGVSAGSACSASNRGGSHVLRAMGVPDALAHSTLRVSFGRWTTETEVDTAAQCVVAAVRRLRAFSPSWRRYQGGASLDGMYGRNAPLAAVSGEQGEQQR